MNNRYIVFDVETPNLANDRISSIGIIVIDNGEKVQEYYTLVNPEVHFASRNTELTGISAKSVKDKPTFPLVWEEIKDIMGSGLLIAHNAQFDMSVLAKTINGYGIEWLPYVYYACTCQMAKECIAEAPDGKLRTLCQMFEVELLEHHNALADARACSELLLKYLDRGIEPAKHLNNFDVLSQHTVKEKHAFRPKLSEETLQLLELKEVLSDISDDGILSEEEVRLLHFWLEQNDNLRGQYPFDKVFDAIDSVLEDGALSTCELQELLDLFERITDPLAHMCGCNSIDVSGKNFCLSGDFEYGSKGEVEAYFTRLGGIPQKNVTKKTDFLIVGKCGSAMWSSGNYGNKVKKAMEMQEKGAAIQIVKEEDITFCE